MIGVKRPDVPTMAVLWDTFTGNFGGRYMYGEDTKMITTDEEDPGEPKIDSKD